VALRILRMYVGFLYGLVLTELQEVVADPDVTDDMLRLGLQRLPAKEFPLLRSLASDLAAYDGEQELDLGLDIFFNGLRTTLTDLQADSDDRG